MSLIEKLNPVGLGMNLMTRFASSDLPDKLGIRKESEQVIQRIAREGTKILQRIDEQDFSIPFLPKKQRATPIGNKSSLAGETTHLFDLHLNADQTMIVDMLADFARQEIRPAANAATENYAVPASLLASAQALGLTSFVIAEQFGGTLDASASAQTAITSSAVIESMAWGDMGLALALLAPMSVANCIARFGSPAQQAAYLPRFTSEHSPLATIAINEPEQTFNPLILSTQAKSCKTGYKLTGRKCMVPLAKEAEFFLIAADTLDQGNKLFIVPANATGVTIVAENSMGLNAAGVCRITLKNVMVSSDACLESNDFNYQQFINSARTAWCALAVGTAQAVLDYVIPYCNERVAFGEPISHRQSVAFMIANMATELEGMRLLTHKAACALAYGETATRSAFLAQQFCSKHAMQIATDGVQLLGGHGFTKEHPVERWYRDLRAVSLLINGLVV